MGLFDRLRRRSVAGSDAGALRPEELVPPGGSWSGLLLDNPELGLAPALTWTFEFRFAEVSREHRDSPVNLTFDWVPLPGAHVSAMSGQAASSEFFSDPIECSAYVFSTTATTSRRSASSNRRAAASVSRPRLAATSTASSCRRGASRTGSTSTGSRRSSAGVDSVEEASRRLSELTDVSGLAATGSGDGIRFVERP